MFESPTLWGVIPLLVFIILAFRGLHPVLAIGIATIVGALMNGYGLTKITEVTQEGLGSFLAFVGLIILAGGGLGKIAEKTGVAENLVNFVMNKIGINNESRAIVGTMTSSTILTGSLGTLAGSNAVIAPVVIPIVATAGLSSTAVAIIFQGAGVTGLWLGPFTPPMVILKEITGLTYAQVLLYASIPLAILMWLTTYFYVKKVNKYTINEFAYNEKDIITAKSEQNFKDNKHVNQATAAFIISLLGLIIYGIIIGGGATYALAVIIITAVITGVVGRLKLNDVAETFFEGAKPLVWLFFQFVLFTPFIQFINDLGGFEALKNLLLPLIDVGGNAVLVILTTVTGIVGIPGAAVAQVVVLDEMFGNLFVTHGIPTSLIILILLVGSQMTELLYPVGDTLGAMGIARSKDLKNMVIFGIVATVVIVIFVIIRSIIGW